MHTSFLTWFYIYMTFCCLKIWKVRYYYAGFKFHTKHMCVHNSDVYQDNAGWWWRWGHEKNSVNPYKNTILAEILCKCAIQGVHLMAVTKTEGTWKLRCSGELLKEYDNNWGVGGTAQWGASLLALLTNYEDVQNKDDAICGTCSIHGKEEKCTQNEGPILRRSEWEINYNHE